jgi:hypothetical protein
MVKDVLRLVAASVTMRSFGGVNPGGGFVDSGVRGLDNRIMADARRTLKSKKSSHRGIGLSAAPEL